MFDISQLLQGAMPDASMRQQLMQQMQAHAQQMGVPPTSGAMGQIPDSLRQQLAMRAMQQGQGQQMPMQPQMQQPMPGGMPQQNPMMSASQLPMQPQGALQMSNMGMRYPMNNVMALQMRRGY